MNDDLATTRLDWFMRRAALAAVLGLAAALLSLGVLFYLPSGLV